MADIQTNISKAIVGFDLVKDAIEKMGVPVGNSPTAQYPDKIALIPAQPAEVLYGTQGRAYIKNVMLPDGVTELGDFAFAGDGNLLSVKMPQGFTGIGSNTFEKCTALIKVLLTRGLTTISNYAFAGCEKLEQVSMGSENICVEIPDSVTSLGVNCFENCKSIKEVKLPEAVETIPKMMFRGCSELRHLIIPETVTKISLYAFSGCSKLNTALPPGVQSIGDYAFQGTALKSAVIPDGAQLGRNCFAECPQLVSVTLPNDLTVVPQAFFQSCTALSDVSLPAGVREISANAFYGCSSLKSLTFPAGLKKLGQSSLAYSGIEEAILPDGLETIESSAFFSCKNLKKIYLPSTLNTPASVATALCTNLENVVLGSGFHINLDVSASKLITVQSLLECLYRYENRADMDALTFSVGVTNVNKIKNIYVAETTEGLEIVTQSTPEAILATEYAENKNIILK